MNFKSQISTTLEQSKRLLALGLKTETADLCYSNASVNGPFYTEHFRLCAGNYSIAKERLDKINSKYWELIPAWSLNRLIEMCPSYLGCHDFVLSHSFVEYTAFNDDGRYRKHPMSVNDNLYDMMIDCIEQLIKDNNFRKEYLNI